MAKLFRKLRLSDLQGCLVNTLAIRSVKSIAAAAESDTRSSATCLRCASRRRCRSPALILAASGSRLPMLGCAQFALSIRLSMLTAKPIRLSDQYSSGSFLIPFLDFVSATIFWMNPLARIRPFQILQVIFDPLPIRFKRLWRFPLTLDSLPHDFLQFHGSTLSSQGRSVAKISCA